MSLWIQVFLCKCAAYHTCKQTKEMPGCHNLAAAANLIPSLYLKLISMSSAGGSELFKGQDPVIAILISLGPDST